MKQHLAIYTWPLAVIATVAAIAYAITAYITSDTAQRAARYYDPEHNELYIRATSVVVRLAGSHDQLVVFAALFAAGTLCAVWLLIVTPRLLHWLGWPRLARTIRG